MDERNYARGVRNAWILTALLILLVAGWTWFSFVTNRDEVEPQWHMGGEPFVPGESIYGVGYSTPEVEPQE